MKKPLLLFACITTVFAAKAQSGTAFDYLDINNVKARFNSAGDKFWDMTSKAEFEVPKGSGASSLFAGSIWIGGYDAGHQLKMAAQTYRQTGNDFWPGPLTSTASINSATSIA